MIRRGKSGSVQKRLLQKCSYQDCDEGLVKGMFGSISECHQCDGLGLVDAETEEALPAQEIIRQLLLRLREEQTRFREYSRTANKLLEKYRDWERGR